MYHTVLQFKRQPGNLMVNADLSLKFTDMF